MGNKIGKRHVLNEEHTRPQGLYQLKEIDLKKLRKLILDCKLAPCYPGADECALDLDECPICFLYYPSLNRSRCCRKMICTECLLQLKASRSNKPTNCPFCKTTNYLVEYHGARTKEEKRAEQAEEQRVVEAQIRMRMHELQDEEERIQKRKGIINSSNRIISPAEVECSRSVSESGWPSRSGQIREDTFDMDLDDMMIFEPIWLSVQDHGTQKNACNSGGNFSSQSSSHDFYTLPSISPTEESRTRVQSEVREVGISYAASNLTVDSGSAPFSLSESVAAANHLLPDNLEEQMMLAMAVSLAEFRARTRSSPGVTWLQ